MYLLVGLGNPGTKYCYNRQNIGYMVIDHLAKNYELPSFKKKTKSSFSVGLIESYKVILLKPTTYMNLSGESVLEIRIPASDVSCASFTKYVTPSVKEDSV